MLDFDLFNSLLRHGCPGNQYMIFMSRMFKVEAWVLLYLFKFRIQIIKMSNVAGISKYWTTLNIFSMQKKKGEWQYSIVWNSWCHQAETKNYGVDG